MHHTIMRNPGTALALMLLAVLTAPTTAAANQQAVQAKLDAGVAAYHDTNYDEAVETFRPLAEQGNARAQLYMGFLYRTGKGVPMNDKKAAMWYKKSAEQGIAEAQLELGRMYELGYGVEHDYWEAEYWYNKLQRNGYCLTDLKDGGRLGNR